MLNAQPSHAGNVMDAIEHGKTGHADVATEHAETAFTYLTEVKFRLT
jgi:hypothetical protein